MLESAMTEKNHNSDNDNDFVRQYGKSAKVKYPFGKNYFYVQKRLSRIYFCENCYIKIGIFYKGQWDCGHYSHHYRDKNHQKHWTIEIDRQFPSECPDCYAYFGTDPERLRHKRYHHGI